MSDQGGHRAGRRVVAAGIDGNVMEWYDFSVYGFFARTIGNLYSPRRIRAPLCSLAFGVFAVGFLMRPLGAVLFGTSVIGWPRRYLLGYRRRGEG